MAREPSVKKQREKIEKKKTKKESQKKRTETVHLFLLSFALWPRLVVLRLADVACKCESEPN